MAKKKKIEEELLQTHVLNLSEIRQAEACENVIKNKKMPVIMSFLGIILIMFGFLYPKLTDYLVNSNEISYVSKLEKNKLTCLSEFYEPTNTYKISSRVVYNFKDNRLTSSNMETIISMVNYDSMVLTNLNNYYNSLYQNVTSVQYNITLFNNSLIFNRTINDYDDFDINLYNPEISNVNRTSIFKGKESFNQVKEKEISLGNSCI